MPAVYEITIHITGKQPATKHHGLRVNDCNEFDLTDEEHSKLKHASYDKDSKVLFLLTTRPYRKGTYINPKKAVLRAKE